MENDRDQHLITKRSKIMEYALEECIKQFDYSNSRKWRNDFKENMLKHARERLIREGDAG